MIRVVLNGWSGKMGQSVWKFAESQEDIEVVAGVAEDEVNGNTFPVFKNADECNVEADVIIDFSRPEALEPIIKLAERKNIPLVVCTTGLEDKHFEMLNELSKKVPVFQESNVSVDFNALLDLVQLGTKLLGDTCDIEIIEKHHNTKIDAPSGSAYMIAEAINDVLDERKEYVYDRHATKGMRSNKEIGIHAIRGGNIVCEHNIMFIGHDERIEINHLTQSKNIFANGSFQATRFLIKQKPGMYHMKDVLNKKIIN